MKNQLLIALLLIGLVGCNKDESSGVYIPKKWSAYGEYEIVGDTVNLGIDKTIGNYSCVIFGKDIFVNGKMKWYSFEYAEVIVDKIIVFDSTKQNIVHEMLFIDTTYNTPKVIYKGKTLQLKRVKSFEY